MFETIDTFERRLRAQQTTAQQTLEECLQRIDPQLNAFITVMADDARRQAREADRELAAGVDRGALHGVPISIKDLIDIRGIPTTAASRVRDGHVAEHDAPLVANLRRAGAVLIGKTNLHEFAFGITNEDSAYGPARNPWDPTRTPGGSSGGSAVSVAAGMAFASIGTDTGGSIRIPAAACGIVGLKPTFGEVPVEGIVPLARTLDHAGPLARSVGDAWLVHRALTGDPAPSPLTAAPVAGLRLAVLRPYFCDLLDDEVRRVFEAALEALRRAGVALQEGRIGHAGELAAIYLHLQLPEASAYHARTLETMPERYTTPVRQRLELGRFVLAEDYVRAQAGREVLRREVDAAVAECDALVLPTLPIPAPPLGAATARVGAGEAPVRMLMLRLTQLFNMTGHPAIAIPCGVTSAGLPCSVQLVGARGHTDALLRIALACEPQIGR
jgi:aspartyl-tRNA(Asn)/glutamyl-tRNA(Gln) amidotransferase subunit A